MTDEELRHAGFDPSDDPRAFRRALGRFATGVTIVTARGDDAPIGITANSFASLSLTPPLVMWSPAKASRRHDVFLDSEHFAINVLSAAQAGLCEAFVRAGQSFEALDHRLNAHGVPLLAGCVAVFECSRAAIHDAGDHTIIVGRVMRAWDSDGLGLLFVNGQFSQLAATAPANPS